MRRILLLLATGGALAASVLAAVECPACGGPSSPAVAGCAFYGALLIFTLVRDDGRLNRFALMAASGFHLGLIFSMASRGAACGLCVAAAGCAFLALGLALAREPRSLPLLPVVLPWTAAFGLMSAPPVPPMEFPEHTRIVAYTRPDCGYCEELKNRVLPEATRGIQVEVQYRDADQAGFVRRAPTLLISRGRKYRVVEGLPTVDRLRDEIAGIEGANP